MMICSDRYVFTLMMMNMTNSSIFDGFKLKLVSYFPNICDNKIRMRDNSLRLGAHKRTTVFIEASNFYTMLAREITSYALDSNLRNRI